MAVGLSVVLAVLAGAALAWQEPLRVLAVRNTGEEELLPQVRGVEDIHDPGSLGQLELLHVTMDQLREHGVQAKAPQ